MPPSNTRYTFHWKQGYEKIKTFLTQEWEGLYPTREAQPDALITGYLLHDIWTLSLKEYLQYLQIRSKWQREEREMRVGDVVLLSDSNTPRNDWKRGIISEVIVSHDGFVRSVKLKTGRNEDGPDSILTRPVHKLVLLLPSTPDEKA